MQSHYRRDYTGEFVVTKTTWASGHKTQTREWIDNPIQNQHISGRAAAIGSNTGLELFDYVHLRGHRGGILGSKTLQTYGTSFITDRLVLDFAVTTHNKEIDRLVANGYTDKNIVYTTASNCVRYPGTFYLIPKITGLNSIVLPLYLAAFDGHEEIFCLGYSKDTEPEVSDWEYQVNDLITAYPGVMWTFVGPETNLFDCWRNHHNVRTMMPRQFISYCDI